jgi:hypothetical protein
MRLVAAALAVLLLAATPSPAPTVPPGTAQALGNMLQKAAGDVTAPLGVDPNHVRGTVTFYKRFAMQLRMPLETYKDVHLHQGTVINPRGSSIHEGDFVDVKGHANSDGSLDADEITII